LNRDNLIVRLLPVDGLYSNLEEIWGLRSYVAFQMAEVAVPRMLFAEILRLIAELRPPPDPAPA
jgi:hypothetical protein